MCRAYCKRTCTKDRCVTDLVDLKYCIRTEWTMFNCWITQSLQLLCISGAVVSQCPSRLAAVISSIVFYFNIVFAAITVTILAVVDQSNSCMLIGQFGSIAVVSYDCFAIGLYGDCFIRRVYIYLFVYLLPYLLNSTASGSTHTGQRVCR